MKKIFTILLFAAFTTAVFGGSTKLSNEDGRRHEYRANAGGESCFTGGTISYIGSNTHSSVPSGWFCLHDKKPAVMFKDGEHWVIKNGELRKK